MKPIFSASGKRRFVSWTFCLMPAMISSVEIEPAFSTINQHRTVAVDMDDVWSAAGAVADGGDVAHINHGAVDRLDRQVAELLDLERRVVELHGVFEDADLLGADRRNQVLARPACWRRPGPTGRAPCNAEGSRSIWNLPLLATVGVGDRSTRHGHQRRAQLLRCRYPARLLLGQAFADNASWMIGTVEAL